MGDEEKQGQSESGELKDSKTKMPFEPGVLKDGDKVIKETVQWEERYHLRAMTSRFIMLVIWMVFWGWLCFVVFPEAAQQKTNEKGEPLYILAKTHDDSKIKTITQKEFNALSDLNKKDWKPKKSAFAFLGENNVNIYIFLVIAGLPFLMTLYRAIYNKVSVSYVLTDYRLIVREGLFLKREFQVRLIQIRDLSVYQGLIQLMLGVGVIKVFSNDADTPELTMEGIRDPVHRKEIIYKISEQKKSEKEFYMGQA